MKTPFEQHVVSQLHAHMKACRDRGVSFADCMAEARVLFNREVREAANATPLPEK